MKIYIVHTDLLDEVEKDFGELTDEEVVQLCEQDAGQKNYDVFDSVEAMAAAWNTEEIFYPKMSYMRVVND